MKKMFYLVWFLCLMTNIALGADAVLMPDGTRVEDIRETYIAPDLGVHIGKADMVQGKAVVIHSGSPAAFWIKEDIPLFKDDAVITLKGGRTRLQLNDGSILTLASETKLILNQSVYDPEAQTRSSFMNMAFGKARFIVKKIKDITDSNFKIKTNTAVVGVRGSDFIITADMASTEVVTLDHTRLEVISLTDPNMTKTVLNDYERIVVDQNALPSAIETISTEDAKQMMKTLEINTEKVQAGMDKNLKGVEGKDALAPSPEKAKDEIKVGLREKYDVKQAGNAVPIITSTEKNGDVKIGTGIVFSEKAKTEQADVKTETQNNIKVGFAPVVEALKSEVASSDKAEIKSEIRADIQTASKEPVFIAAPATELPQTAVKYDIRTDVQNAVKEPVFIAAPAIEGIKVEVAEKPAVQDILHSSVISIVGESKDTIQKVAEIKVQSATDTTNRDKVFIAPLTQSQTGSTNSVQTGTVVAVTPADTNSLVSEIGIVPSSTPASTDTKLPISTDTTQPVSSTDTKLPVSTVVSTVVSTDTKLPTSTDTTQPVSSTDTKLPVSTVVSTDTKLPTSTDTKSHVSTLSVSTDTKLPVATVVSTDTKPAVSTSVSTDTKLHVSTLPVSTPVSTDTKLPVSSDTKLPVSTDTKLPVSTDTKPAVATDTTPIVTQVADVIKSADILPVVTDTKLTRSKMSHILK
jgi:hypothetical protein